MTLFLYTPSPLLGGTETLALRIAGELRARAVEATVVTTADGWLARQAAIEGLSVISISEFDARTPQEHDRVLSSAKYLLDPLLQSWKDRTLYWLLHPLEFAWVRFPRIYGLYRHLDSRACGRFFRLTSPRQFTRMRLDFDNLQRRRQLLSMSEDCSDFLRRFLGRRAALPLVSLPLSARDVAAAPATPPTRCDGFAYFGRIEQFKTASILRLIDDIAQAEMPAARKALVLFGYGADESTVTAHAVRRGVRLTITGAITVADVIARTRSERLLAFAMGLSGLDLLLGGVPCVFVPVPSSPSDRRGNYGFLHQLPNGCVGSYPEFLDPARSMTFSQVLDVMHGPRLAEALRLDVERMKQEHSLTGVVEQLQSHLSTMTVADRP
jgi:hypothetical protein